MNPSQLFSNKSSRAFLQGLFNNPQAEKRGPLSLDKPRQRGAGTPKGAEQEALSGVQISQPPSPAAGSHSTLRAGVWVCKPSKHQIKRQERNCRGRAQHQWQGGAPTDKKEGKHTLSTGAKAPKAGPRGGLELGTGPQTSLGPEDPLPAPLGTGAKAPREAVMEPNFQQRDT